MVRIANHVDARTIEQAVASAASQPVETDPGMGYWDGYDTGHPAEMYYGVRPHGGALVRVRVVAGAGPCSREVEVIRVA